MNRTSSPAPLGLPAARLLTAITLGALLGALSPMAARGGEPEGPPVAISGTGALSAQREPELSARIVREASNRSLSDAAPLAQAQDTQPRERETFWAWDFRLSTDYALQARLRHASQQIWIYVEDNAGVSDLAIARLARTFEDQIQPRLRSAYGREPYPGIDGREAITILLLDVRDDVHHRLPPYQYISGYFDAVNQLAQAQLGAGSRRRSNEREMIYLDVAPTDSESDVLLQSAAHEYAHLIAWNHDPDEERWLDEVIGQLAVHVAGLPHPADQLNAFLAAPEDALVDWTGDVSDYGQAYAFGVYAYEQLGGQGSGAAARLVQDPRNGLASLGALVPAPGSIGTLLRDFGLALQLDLPEDVDPRYGIRALDIGDGPDAFPRPSAHVSAADALPTGEHVVTLPPWSVRFEHVAVDGAPLNVSFASDAPFCYGASWIVGDSPPSEPPIVDCALGGRREDVALAAPPRHGTLALVVANPSDRPLALTRRAVILLEAQSTKSRVYLPFGQAGGGRGRSTR